MSEDATTTGITIEQRKADNDVGEEIRGMIQEAATAIIEGKAGDIARFEVYILDGGKPNRYQTKTQPIEISNAMQRAASTIVAKKNRRDNRRTRNDDTMCRKTRKITQRCTCGDEDSDRTT